MTRHHPLAPRLDRVARRLRLERACLVIGIGSLLVAILVLWAAAAGTSIWPTLIGGIVLTAAAVTVVRTRPDNALALAHLVERRHPDLQQRLVTAVEQEPRIGQGGLSYLQHSLVADVMSHDDANDWRHTIPGKRLAAAVGFEVLGLLLLAVVCGWAMTRPSNAVAGGPTDPEADPVALVGPDGKPIVEVVVEPGNVEIERGSPLLVTGRFANEALVPADAILELRRDDETMQRAMSRSVVDPLFSTRLSHVEEPLEYRVTFTEGASDWFTVDVYDLPRLEKADATIELPAYTGLEPETIEDVRFVTALEGSTIELRCTLNKPVTSAVLKPEEPGDELALAVVEGEPNMVSVRLKPEANVVYRLHLTDADGRSNSNPPLFDIELVANRPPDVRVTFPARDLEVSPIEEIAIDATAKDDFGVVRWGVVYAVAGRRSEELILGEGTGRREEAAATAMLRLEEHGAEPDELVTYYLFAEDHGPDGAIRRTLGDMFFAEVRSFEEIFREGQSQAAAREQQQQQQQQQQSAAGQQAEQQAAEQKEIVTATWNLIRRETAATPSAEFGPDVDAIREAQEQALEKLGEMEVTDPESQRFLEQAGEQMTTAVEQLARARELDSADPLHDALAAEQAAYQSLLKLRAREHEVVRGQPQQQQQQNGQQQQQGNRSQQQLNQLELRNQENRYQNENESQLQQAARDAQQQQRDQALQTLNRLRELSRRQSAVNDKLRELESELRTAETEEEREELERELKRLRDEQRELLRDVDQLRNENERNQAEQQAQNQQNQNQQNQAQQNQNQQTQNEQQQQQRETREQAETQRQLDETRERVRQASEALERGQTSRALAEGTRAERQLDQLREDFRRRTANEFEDEMRDLRDRARELSGNQEELQEQLDRVDDPMNRSLRAGSERREIEERLRSQKEDLDEILDDVREVVEQAEEAEPVLSRQLYDTVRELRRTQPGERLEDAAEDAGRGRYDEARTEAANAREGIEQLREGIERAAEGVVGDSTEALRRARDTLRNLERELDREVAENDPRAADRDRRPGEPNDAERDPSERQPGEREPGERQPGEGEPGERQPGERQPGEERRGEAPPMGGQPMGGGPGGGQPGERPNDRPADQPGDQPGENENPGERPGQRPGENPRGEQPNEGQPRQRGLRGGPQTPNQGGNPNGGGSRQPANNPDRGPLTGQDYRDWADQLRVVEELIDDPELRGEAARIRERARAVRAEFERHSREPEWDLVRDEILKPLVELERQVAEEVARRRADGELVPIDRDPVPEEYRELVRRYYEDLGERE